MSEQPFDVDDDVEPDDPGTPETELPSEWLEETDPTADTCGMP